MRRCGRIPRTGNTPSLDFRPFSYTQVYIGNYEYDARRAELEREFRQFGPIEHIDFRFGTNSCVQFFCDGWAVVCMHETSSCTRVLFPKPSGSSMIHFGLCSLCNAIRRQMDRRILLRDFQGPTGCRRMRTAIGRTRMGPNVSALSSAIRMGR